MDTVVAVVVSVQGAPLGTAAACGDASSSFHGCVPLCLGAVGNLGIVMRVRVLRRPWQRMG